MNAPSPNARAPRSPQIKRPKHKINGWINLDKPLDMTSTQAVGAVKHLLAPEKIGHAGTLDPLATGVLPLALGEATKTVQYMMDSMKIYRFTVCFGTQTTTDDREGEAMTHSDVRPDDAAIAAALPHFEGTISQVPPVYSAIKIAGERAYDLARAGEHVVLQPRSVYIARCSFIERLNADEVVLEVECGKGTYVRSLARDLAAMLGSCGHVSALRRTKVGRFHVDHAISLDDLPNYAISDMYASMDAWLEPIECALDDIPAVTLDATQAQRLRHGNSCFVPPSAFARNTGYVQEDGHELYQAYHAGRLIALVLREDRVVFPLRQFNLNH
ncbi:MAG: tRNA pseudouridine(55) synthase TruB [Alphaproteobacteria bacterium]|nr:MAG: tRNA pseudouridine(55) synthase TruB [Alphaproteobacteria bacterium]